MKKKIAYSAAAAFSALLALAFMILFVITLLPVGVDGLRIEEPIRVSSSAIDAEGTRYLVQVRGSLINENDDPIKADAIVLRVRGENADKTVTLDGATLYTRLSHDLFYEWESDVPYDRVDAVHLTLDGKETRIENREESVIGADTVVTLAVALVAAFLFIGFAKQRYYLYQEEQMKK